MDTALSTVASSSRRSPPLSPPLSQTRTKSVSPPSNLAASTSKVKVEDIPPNGDIHDADYSFSRLGSSVYEPSPTAPKARAALPQHPMYLHTSQVVPMAYPPYVPRVVPGAIPAVPARALHPSLTATFPAALHPWQPWQLTKEPSPPRSPPPAQNPPINISHSSANTPKTGPPSPPPARWSAPDPRYTSRPPPTSYSNPLQIKPAFPLAPPPQTPAVASPVASGSKKPVQVGNGWPYNTRSHAKAAAANANGAAKAQPAKPQINHSASPPVMQSAGPSTPAPSQNPSTESTTTPSASPAPQQTPAPIPVKPQPPTLRVSLSGVTSYHNMYGSGKPKCSKLSFAPHLTASNYLRF